MKKNLLLFIASFIFNLQSYSQLEQVIHEEVATGPIGGIPEGYSVYRIYALLTNSNYKVTGLTSSSTVGYSHRIILGSCSSEALVWNSAQGGITGDDANCSLYTANPDVEYDSYLTIQRSSSCSAGTGVTNTASTALTNSLGVAPYGSTLNSFGFSINTSAPQSPTGPDFRVLIAQVTIPTGTLVYAFNINVTHSSTAVAFKYVHDLDDPINVQNNELDGSQLGLVYGLAECNLCNDISACNYNPAALVNNYCEHYSCRGCTDPTAMNFDPEVSVDDGSCYHSIPDLVFSEFFYGAVSSIPNPLNHPNNYAEIYNNGDEPVDLTGYQVRLAYTIDFPAGTIIQPEESIVLTSPQFGNLITDYQKFTGWSFETISPIDSIKLLNNDGVLVDYVSHKTTSPWPSLTHSIGASLCLSNTNLDNYNGANWCHSAEYYGSPGQQNTCRVNGCNNPIACNFQPEANFDNGTCIYCECGYICGCMDSEALNYNPEALWHGEECQYTIYDIVINEIKTGNATTNFVELYNNDDVTVDMSNYYIAYDYSGAEGFSFYFPVGTTIAPGEYILVHGATTIYNGPYQSFQWSGTGNMAYGSVHIYLNEQHGAEVDRVNTLSSQTNLWPNNGNKTRELINPNSNNAIPDNWCLSTLSAGSPGLLNGCYSPIISGCLDSTAYNYEPLAEIGTSTCNYQNGGSTCSTAVSVECGHYYDGLISGVYGANDNLTSGVGNCGFLSPYPQNWYSYQSEEDALVSITTCYAQTTYPLTIQVFYGECGELVCHEASNEGNCINNGRPELEFMAQAGVEYLIRVAATTNVGTSIFRVKFDCENATVDCADATACNYDPEGLNNLGCDYSSCLGCMDPEAMNFDTSATISDSSCYYENPKIVINEFLRASTTTYQFLELINVEDYDVDISGWEVNYGNVFRFPTGTIIPSGNYVLIGDLPNYPLGPNSINESTLYFDFPANFTLMSQSYLVLYDNFDNRIDTVSIAGQLPTNISPIWRSIELINPFLDNNYAPNWQIPLSSSQQTGCSPACQNTVFNAFGETCRDSTACNYNPYLDGNPLLCDYTCFWPDETPDNDDSYSPVTLYDGSSLVLYRTQMAFGISSTIPSCNPVFHDVWFKLNTENFDSLHVELNPVSMPQFGVTVYRKVGESLQEVYCTVVNDNFRLKIESIAGFDSNQTYYISIYVLTNVCNTCNDSRINIHADFYRSGCTDSAACNYNEFAIVNDGSCEYLSCSGCTNPDACNYDINALIDDGSCCLSRCVEILFSTVTNPNDLILSIINEVDQVVFESSYQPMINVCLTDSCYEVRIIDDSTISGEGSTLSILDEVGVIVSDVGIIAGDTTNLSFCLNQIVPIGGCTDPLYCNYNPDADFDDNTCSENCPGCTIGWAMNFNPSATFNDGSCIFPPAEGTTCSSPIQLFCNGQGFNFNTQDIPNDNFNAGLTGLSCIQGQLGEGQRWFIYTSPVSAHVNILVNQLGGGCLGFGYRVHVFNGSCGDFECVTLATNGNPNFDALAGEVYYIRVNLDDDPFGCFYYATINLQCWEIQDGCMDEEACNFNPDAEIDNQSCDYSCYYGCTIVSACNYNPEALINDGSCFFNCIYGCLDIAACNYSPLANTPDNSCLYLEICIPGCTDVNACNYDPNANIETGNCDYSCLFGCMDENACNYISTALFEDNSCLYPGCTDIEANNYDPNAGCEGLCTYSCAGDYNDDGSVGMDDFLDLLNAFGCFDNCAPYDFNGDGIVGTSDIQLFLSQFGVSCE